MTRTLEAWHFLPDDRRMQFGIREPVEAGQTYEVAPPLVLCTHGLHASVRPIDALKFAPGSVICRVVLSGEILEDENKACATRRTVLWMADLGRVLHEFGVWCAAQALLAERDAGREPDVRSWAALEVKRRWLRGEAASAELASARTAARAAVRVAASAAAWDAAEAAVSASARTAAWAAASAAASAAAWAAAGAAAFDAASASAKGAAWAAVWAAASAAARDAQNTELERLLLALAPEAQL